MNNTIYGVIGHNGKLGRLLSKRPNFAPVECDITSRKSIYNGLYSAFGEEQNCDVLVNCAGIASIDECEKDEKRANEVNVRGTYNIHSVFGERVLTISSDHVFSGIDFEPPTESMVMVNPVNIYGWSKVGAEAVSSIQGGKVIRLSRVLSLADGDISRWLQRLHRGEVIEVPTFFHRNYLTQCQAVDGIEYLATHYDNLPSTVNYGSIETISMFEFMTKLAGAFGLDTSMVIENKKYDDTLPPRPLKAGLNTSLAYSLGFPMYSIDDVVKQLVKDVN